MDDKRLEEKYGVTAEQISEWSTAAEQGEYPGKPGRTTAGRPLMFGEELLPVTFKEPRKKIAAIDTRARSQGMSRSDYLRDLVNKDLAGIA